MDTCYHVTLWFCSVAIDNGPCVDDLPTQMVIFHGNLLNYQRVSYAIAGCLWSGWFHYSNVWCKKSWPLLVSVVDIWLMNLISCNYYVILHFDMYAYYIYTYIYTHSYIHTYIHTYIHNLYGKPNEKLTHHDFYVHYKFAMWAGLDSFKKAETISVDY